MTSEAYMKLKALREISKRLDSQSQMLSEMKEDSRHHGWWSDFSSNIAGNAAWDGLVYLARLIFKR